MKKILLFSVLMIAFLQFSFAQTTVFTENFELPSGADSVSSQGTPTWTINSTYYASGSKSMHNVPSTVVADTLSLVTNSFSTLNMSQVILSFSHICKLEHFDNGEIEVSADGGVSWTKLNATQYLGTSQFGTLTNRFTATSYPIDWDASVNTTVPTNSWWKSESFDISSIAGNKASVKVRFRLSNGPVPGAPGANGAYGWLIDDIKVVASASELNPPSVTLLSPIFQDTIFGSGPYKIAALVNDLSGIDTVKLFYKVMNGAWDSLGMVRINPDTFYAYIPFPGFGRVVTYYIKATDASPAHNITQIANKSFFCKYSNGGEVIIGTGTTTATHLPLEAYYGYSYTQTLYKPAYFNGNFGNITKIAYYYAGLTAWTDNITIYIGTTPKTSFTGTTDYIPVTNLTQVYTGNMTTTTTPGWIEFTLQTPFAYSGSNNLVVAFDENTSGYHGSSDYFRGSTLDADIKSIYYYQDASDISPSSPSATTSGTSAITPNTKFVVVGSSSLVKDIGVSQIISPTFGMGTGQNYDVKVKIKNFGIDTITTSTVNWMLDGVTQTPFTCTDSLKPGLESSLLTLGSKVATGGNHSLVVWTENPNGVADNNWGNDTMKFNFFVCSSTFTGNYTIGGTSPDFATINDALTAIGQCGIAGPIVFNIAPGTYTQQVSIGNINGASATNTVTFKSANGDSTGVILQYDAVGASDNFVLQLNGAKYITVKGVTIKALDPTYAKVVVLSGNLKNITLRNNIFEGTQSTNTDSNQFILQTFTGNQFDSIYIIGNKFNNGRFAVNFVTNPAATNVVMKYNNMNNQASRPMNLNGLVGLDFGYNILFSDATKTTNGGSFLTNLTGQWKFYNNKMINLAGVRVWEGWTYGGTTAGQEALVYNNYLYGSSASSYVFDGGGAVNNIKFYHNTFVGNSTGRTVNFNNYYGANTNITFKNNIMQSTGQLLYFTANPTGLYIDNNDYYTTGASWAYFWGTTATSIATIKSASTQEANCMSINPQFVGTTDPHITNFGLKGLGTPVPEVTTDIDGQIRSTTAPDPGCDEFLLYTDDAGVYSMLQTTLCPGTNDVKVKLKNFGSNVLNSATINWSINGAVQTPFNYTGAMASLGDTNIILGSYNFLNTTSYTLKFWTSVPNATTDGNVQNDTLLISNFHTSFTGTYTVGGTSADFATPIAAITALNTYGLCGPTVLNINPGTYEGRLTIGNIVGASAVNTLTIKSLNNDTTAIITDSATATTNNWIIRLNGANYVTIKSLSLVAKYNATFGTCLLITNTSKNNTIIGNAMYGVQSTNVAITLAVVSNVDLNSKPNNIIGNSIFNGSIGIYMMGTSTTVRMDSIYLYKNVIRNYFQNGIQIQYANSPIIDSNVIITATGSTVARAGMNINYAYDNVRITRNTINVSNSTSLIGILFGNCTSTATTKSLIANNFVTLINTAGTTAYGLRIYPSNYVRIAYNSLYVSGPSPTETRGINCVGGTYNEVISNNVVSNNYPCFYEGTAVTYSDYNNFYSTTNRYAYFNGAYQNFTSQAALTAGYLKDSNSVSVDPYFISNSDLHTLAGALNGMAKVVPEVTVDIDGDLRSTSAPDIGADEFTPSPYDLNANAIVSPLTGCGLSNQETVTLKIKNVGSVDANGGFTASYQIKGSTNVVTENVPDTIVVGGFKNFSFATKADMTIGSLVKDSIFQFKAWTSWVSDPITINDTTIANITSGYKPAPPTVSNFTANYATKPTITATSTDTLVWYAANTSTTPLYIGKYFTTPFLYDTTTYYVGAKSMTGLACVSDRVPLVVNIINYPNIDAGVTAITDPTTNIPSKLNHALKVDIKNYGMNTITSAKVYYSLNGTLTDSLMWSGSLVHGAVANIEVDSLYLAGGVYTLKVWTSLPNAIADTFNYNDTATFIFNACMQGTYTIGKTPSVTYDFPSFTAANNALVAAGVCGNVIFLVDTGTYEERMYWNPVTGVGPNATITFQSLNGDSTSVTLRYTLSSAAAWAMKFTGASYFKFKKIKMSVLGSNTWGRIMEIAGSSHHLTFENCILEGVTGANTSTNFATIFTSPGTNSYNTFRNNKVLNGAYAFYIYGTSTSSWDKGNVIEGNDISGFYYYGVYAYYQDSIQIVGNYIHDGSTSTQYGINSNYCNNAYRIINNNIKLSGSTNYGIRDYYNNYYSYNANPSGYGLVANNMISLNGASNYGLYAYYSNGSEYYFNSIRLSNGSTAYGVYQYNTTSNSVGQKFKNNIFVNSGTGYAAYFGTPASVVESNYNNFYNPNSNIAYWNAAHTTLASLKNASGKEANSLSIAAPFFSSTDLHLLSTNLSAKGQFINKVPKDIDGELRGAIPTIGADEVPLKPIDGGVSTVIVPPSTTFEYDTIYPKVIVCNYGTDTLFTIPVSYTVNNGTPVTFNYVDTLAQYQCDTVNLPYFISPAGNSTFCAKTLIVGDSNAFNDQTCKNFFGTPSKDAVASRIIKLAEGCGLTTDTVRLVIKNIGGIVINGGITASYRVNNSSTVITQAVTNTIALNDSITFVFNTPINLSVTTKDSIFNVKAWVTYTGDNVQYNDTTTTLTKSFHTPPTPVVNNVTIPYGTSVTINATSTTNDSLIWYDSPVLGTKLKEGSNYTTPILFTTDTFHVEARGGGAGANALLGTGTTYNANTSYPTPYGNYWWGSKHQYLVTASELTALGAGSGPITSLAFNVQAVNSCPGLQNYYIKIGHTTQSALSATYVTGLTQVFSNASYQPVNGWNVHTFQNSFNWNGTDNIVVEVCFNNTSYVTAGCASVYNSVTSFTSSSYNYGDNANNCTTTSSTYTSTTRPNMLMVVAPSGCSSARTPLIVTVGNPSPIDAGVVAITAPQSSVYMSNQETVKVKIRNYGTTAITNFPVSYKLGSLATVTETFTGSILAQDSAIFTFSAKAAMGIAGTNYSFVTWTNLSGDATALNDTAKATILHKIPTYCNSAATSTSYYDIENVNFAGINNTSLSPFTALYTNYTSIAPGAISGGNTYPVSIGINTSTSITTSGYCKVFIDYNRDGVYTEPDETAFGSTFSGVSTITGNITVPSTVQNGVTQMRVVAVYNVAANLVVPCGTYTYGETEDYSIIISPMISQDISVEKFIQPSTLVSSGVGQSVVVRIKNVGSDTILPNTLSVGYVLNTNALVSQMYPDTLKLGDTAWVSFNNVIFPAGYNSLCFKTTLPGDTNVFNNDLCKTVFGESQASIPYTDNFDAANIWYANDSVWQRGTPSKTNISTTPTSPNVWVTRLTGNYPNSTESYILSPKFNFANLGVTDTATLKFMYTIYSETNLDAGLVQYSTNGGLSWVNLTYMTDPFATNGYNSSISGLHCWTGNVPWTLFTMKLDPTIFNQVQPVQFRIRFFSNASGNAYDGMAIDNFKIEIPLFPIEASLDTIYTPINSMQYGTTSSVKIRIKNNGFTTLTSIPVHYTVNGGAAVSDTWTGSIGTGGTSDFTFTTPIVNNYSGNSFNLCAAVNAVGDAYTQNDSVCYSVAITPPAKDAGVIKILNPVSDTTFLGQWGHSIVKVRIKNFGSDTLTSMDVQYVAGTQSPIVENWTGSLKPNDSIDYTFSQTYSSPTAFYSLCAKTLLTGDARPINDQICKTKIGVVSGVDENWLSLFKLEQNVPNPTKGITQIEFETPVNGNVSFTLTNILGQIVNSQNMELSGGKHSFEIDVNSLDQGIYYYSIELNGHRLTKKMVVIK